MTTEARSTNPEHWGAELLSSPPTLNGPTSGVLRLRFAHLNQIDKEGFPRGGVPPMLFSECLGNRNGFLSPLDLDVFERLGRTDGAR